MTRSFQLRSRTTLRKKRPSAVRLSLERLEDRLVPAQTFTWNGNVARAGFDPKAWDDAANWRRTGGPLENSLPAPGDTVIIDRAGNPAFVPEVVVSANVSDLANLTITRGRLEVTSGRTVSSTSLIVGWTASLDVDLGATIAASDAATFDGTVAVYGSLTAGEVVIQGGAAPRPYTSSLLVRGSVTATSSVTVGAGGIVNLSGGVINVPITTIDGRGTGVQGGKLQGWGFVVGNVESAGTVEPTIPGQAIRVDGAFSTSGTVVINTFGRNASVISADEVTLSGTLQVRHIGGDKAKLYRVIASTDITGNFANYLSTGFPIPPWSRASDADGYVIYEPTLTLSATDSTSGTTSGGQILTLTGEGFLGAEITAVKFGAVSAPYFRVMSDTEIQVLTPANTAGAVNLSVIWPGDTTVLTDSLTNDPIQYTYSAPAVELSSSANPSPTATGVTWTATRLSGSATSAAFYYDEVYIGTSSFASNVASYTFPSYMVTSNEHSIHVIVDGTSNYFATQVNVGAKSITSDDNTTFTVGSFDSFTVTTGAGGFPNAAFSLDRPLPDGLTLTDNLDGTATIAGTPVAGTGGSYTLTINAFNGVGSPATQEFTLTVQEQPAIVSPDFADFYIGQSTSFTVSTMGLPVGTLTTSGSLPSGLTFTDNEDGTATISGTPASSTEGSYTITVTADNDVGSNATQSLTIKVGRQLIVDNDGDSGTGTLRAAISQANSNANSGISSTIIFDGVTDILLTSGSLALTGHNSGATINILGSATIDGDNTYSVFTVAADVIASMNWLTLTNGSADVYGGGGILNYGTLTMTGCTISNCVAPYGAGGGIANYGSALFESGELSGNSADAGGGAYNSGTLAIRGSTVTGNDAQYGGGVYNEELSGEGLLIEESFITGNVTTYSYFDGSGGAGVYNNGTATISRSTISANDDGGIRNLGTMTLIASTVADNTASDGAGGGIYNLGTITAADCTISGNQAVGYFGVQAGGVLNTGAMTLSNCTISGNSASSSGDGAIAGGISNGGDLIVTHCTIAANTVDGLYSALGGGIYNGTGADVVLYNSIVAGNTTSSNDSPDVYGDISGFGNIIGDGDGMTGISNGVNGNHVGVSWEDVALDDLADNGGPTLTMALLEGSIALGAGVAPTKLDGSINSSTTSIAVDDVSALGLVAGYSVLQIGTEKMFVTGIDGDTLTVIRGFDGTTAASHVDDANIFSAFDQRGVDRLRDGDIDIGALSSQEDVQRRPRGVISLQPQIGPGTNGTQITITVERGFDPNTPLTVDFIGEAVGQPVNLRTDANGHATFTITLQRTYPPFAVIQNGEAVGYQIRVTSGTGANTVYAYAHYIVSQ